MGAIGDPYITTEQLKQYLQFEGSFVGRDDELLAACLAASAKVEECCDRQFNKTDTASERVYEPTPGGRLLVDDFWSTDDLLIESDQGSWALPDLVLRPLNGISFGRPGWPFWEITSEPKFSPLVQVRVTAKWGWAEVPAPVIASTKIIAAQLFKMSETPLGVAGFSQFGASIRVRDFPQVKMLLAPYDRDRLQVG